MPEETQLSVARNTKIGLFHLGSGMSEIVVLSVWNRVMVSDLGFSAALVGLLTGLRYFLAPVSIWAGRISDQRAVGGFRRLFWIWLGRALMVVSILALGVQTAALVGGTPATPLTWLILTGSLLLFSLGNAISGSTFLALLYDRAPEHLRGRVVGIVWTFLLLGYSIGGPLFGILLPAHEEGQAISYTPETLQNLFLFGAVVMGVLWVISLWGEERRLPADQRGAVASQGGEHQTSVFADLRLVFANRTLRYFFWFLSLSMLFAFSQDVILEPFGGDVHGISASHTTRFAAYWGSMAILSTLLFIWLGRKFPTRLTNTNMSYIGIAVLLGSFAWFAVSSFAGIRWMVTPGLIALGIGLGVWNVGTLGLMMDMSPAGRAGTFLGFWTLVVSFSKGIGNVEAGVLRDLALNLTGSMNLAYAVPFAVGAVGLAACLWLLREINVQAFKQSQNELLTPQPADQILAGAMD